MRDSNEGMIELLNVEKIYGNVAVHIRLAIGNESVEVKFAGEQSDYSKLKRILENQPFQPASDGKYRYFMTQSYTVNHSDRETPSMHVRVEQLERHKEFPFPISRKFLQNLEWFKQLESKEQIADLLV